MAASTGNNFAQAAYLAGWVAKRDKKPEKALSALGQSPRKPTLGQKMRAGARMQNLIDLSTSPRQTIGGFMGLIPDGGAGNDTGDSGQTMSDLIALSTSPHKPEDTVDETLHAISLEGNTSAQVSLPMAVDDTPMAVDIRKAIPAGSPQMTFGLLLLGVVLVFFFRDKK